MKTFPVVELYNICTQLVGHKVALDSLATSGGGGKTRQGLTANIRKLFSDIEVMSKKYGFAVTGELAAVNGKHLDGTEQDFSTLAAEVKNMSLLLERDLFYGRFLAVSLDRSKYIDQEDLFGPKVYEAFPSARADIREAGNCMAAECNTAAVFHLMRATEWGLRALCKSLGFTQIKRTKQSGKVIYSLVSYSEWEKILDALQDKVDVKLRTLKRGKDKQNLQEFYYPALQDIRGLRDAWRNHVMHTRSEYSREDAAAVLGHVERLMKNLATRVSEA